MGQLYNLTYLGGIIALPCNDIIACFFQDLLSRHKMLVADFLEANFDKVFTEYQKLLHSDNYVTRRQSLKLLGELLLDRHNFSVRKIYLPREPGAQWAESA